MERRSARFRFLIETHSEPLVSQVAAAVAAGDISPEDVRIYLFERESQSHESRVYEARIGRDGRIADWPFGFFSTGKLPRAGS
jgi:predicted ATPase